MTIERTRKNSFEVTYSDKPHRSWVAEKHDLNNHQTNSFNPQEKTHSKKKRRSVQRDLW
jgi:hypothetical protein